MDFKSTADNKVLPKVRPNGFGWTFVQGSTLVTLLNFCAKIHAFGKPQSLCKIVTKKSTNGKNQHRILKS